MKFYFNLLNRLKNKKSEQDPEKIIFERQCPHCTTRGVYSFKFIDKIKQSSKNQNDNKH